MYGFNINLGNTEMQTHFFLILQKYILLGQISWTIATLNEKASKRNAEFYV